MTEEMLEISAANRLFGNGLNLLSRLTQRTARYQVAGLEHYKVQEADDGPVIWTAWHGMTMMLAGFFLRYYDLSNLVLLLPDDWRGESLFTWVKKIGAEPFPMNLEGDASMSSARRLAQLLRMIRRGRDCYITPDGPEGPAYVIKPGVAFLASKSGAPILPLGAYVRHGYRLNRWDRYAVPYPFSRISIVVGKPLQVPVGSDLEEVSENLTDILHRVTAQSAANFYEIKE